MRWFLWKGVVNLGRFDPSKRPVFEPKKGCLYHQQIVENYKVLIVGVDPWLQFGIYSK